MVLRQQRRCAVALLGALYAVLLILLSACQGNVNNLGGQSSSTQSAKVANVDDQSTPTGGAMPFMVPHHSATVAAHSGAALPTAGKGTPTTGTAVPVPGTSGATSGPGSTTTTYSNGSNTATLPAGFPHYFSFGVMNSPGVVSSLDAMRSQNGTSYAFRYQYLTGGVNTGHGWETWNKPAGQYAANYMLESAQHGYMPVFVYYEICLSNGPQPSSYCGGHNIQQDTGNLANGNTMQAYYANWVLMLQKIGAFGKPAMVIVEPDLWGFLQNATNGTDNAANVSASVSSSGFADAAGYPDTAQGFAWALLHMRDKYAPNAVLALHASTWQAGTDIATDTRSNLDVGNVVRREANFLNSEGLTTRPAGVSSWDLLSNDVADFDSAQPGGRSWWDRYNQTFPNFSRYLTFIGGLSQATHHRVVMWQVPMGNQYFDTMNNSAGHYQDNRAEYILGNVASFAAAGVIAVLFGPGNGGTINTDVMNDGVTNPAPINSYECNGCNTHVSIYPDDDGGYLRIFVGQYMQRPVAIS